MRMHITSLLRCYPPAWRDRYETEMTALLEEHQAGVSTWFDLLRGAFDARLDPAFAGGLGPVMTRLRRSEIIVFCSFIAYFIAGIGFQKMTEDADKAGVMSAHFSVGFGYYAVIAGAVVAGLSVLAGALPIGLSLLRQAIADRRRDILGLLAVPVVLFVAVVGFGAYVAQSNKTIDSGFVRGWIIFTLVAVALSAASVALAVSRADLSTSTLRLARIPALSASLAMALSLIGVVVWGLGLRASSPDLFSLNGGALISYAYFTWLRVVVVMGLSTVAAITAIWRTTGPADAQLSA
jgi:hypothetical protein